MTSSTDAPKLPSLADGRVFVGVSEPVVRLSDIEAMRIDEEVVGVRSFGPFTISGRWEGQVPQIRGRLSWPPKVPRRTKKALLKLATGRRLTDRERARVARVRGMFHVEDLVWGPGGPDQ